MKKKLLILSLLLLIYAAFTEEPPIKSGGWHWDNGVNLNGKKFYNVSESYKEQDGWAYIEGFGKIHYWLYDTYTYQDGRGKSIIDRYVPKWIESMGYVIDYDHMRTVYPNNSLASSVKALETKRL